MGMMTGGRWRRGVAALALTLPAPVAAGCDQRTSLAAGSAQDSTAGLDASGRAACAEFRAGWQRATDTPARLRLADRVGLQARRSDSAAITQPAAAMSRSADDGDRAWRAAAADLLRACGRPGEDAVAPALPVTG